MDKYIKVVYTAHRRLSYINLSIFILVSNDDNTKHLIRRLCNCTVVFING